MQAFRFHTEMIKMIRFPLLFTAVLFMWSCSNDDGGPPAPAGEAKLVLNFQPHYNGSEMHLETRYDNIHGCTFALTDLKFYLSNITLHYDNGEALTLSEIELIDFKENHNTLDFPLSGGEFVGISFDLGVPSHLNGTTNPDFLTSVYSTDHPLSALNNTYWTWQSGYRFFMADGKFDTIPGSTADPMPTSFSFHTGRDELFRSPGRFDRSVSGIAGTQNHLFFALDFEKLFFTEQGVVDLRVERNFHGNDTQMELGIRVADNTAEMFRLIE